MTLDSESFIWATRGHSWGFRFLRTAGYADPLPVYDAAFAAVQDEREVCKYVGSSIVLRFADPEGRKDFASRVIRHDFILFPIAGSDLPALDNARRVAWESVAGDYERVWESPNPSE